MIRYLMLLFSLLPQWAVAETNTLVDNFVCAEVEHRRVNHLQKPVLMYEVARIHDALDICNRPRDSQGTENYLYTWGHKDKLVDMLSMDRLAFCSKDQARLLTFIGIQYDKSQTANPPRNKLIDQALEDVIKNSFEVPSTSYYPAIKGKSYEAMEKDFKKGLESCTNVLCQAHFQGRLVGLAQTKNNDSGRLNTSTFGTGVSFATDPVTFANHYQHDTHAALVCRTYSDNLPITDIYSGATIQSLENLNIFIPATGAGAEWATRRSIFPFYNPLAFSLASHNRILRVQSNRPVYLDKCAIEYQTSCRYLAVDNLSDCHALAQLNNDISTLITHPESMSIDKIGNVKKVSYYLIQQGKYVNTDDLLSAIQKRYSQRCL